MVDVPTQKFIAAFLPRFIETLKYLRNQKREGRI